MTVSEFNTKYIDFLEGGHYGLDIEYPSVVEYLDKIFEGLIKIPGFKYSQIKWKFNSSRFYSNLNIVLPNLGGTVETTIEYEINRLVVIEDEVNKRLKNK